MLAKGFNTALSGVGRTTVCLASVCCGEARSGTCVVMNTSKRRAEHDAACE